MINEKVERLRRKAEECLQNAAQASKPETKVMWLEMAQQYLHLAESFERVSAQGTVTGPLKARDA